MFKNCHQHCYEFEILMSSWGVWVLFSKLLWENVFLKNHAKSRVSENSEGQRAFFELFVQFEQNFDIFRNFRLKGFLLEN